MTNHRDISNPFFLTKEKALKNSNQSLQKTYFSEIIPTFQQLEQDHLKNQDLALKAKPISKFKDLRQAAKKYKNKKNNNRRRKIRKIRKVNRRNSKVGSQQSIK